MTRSAGEDGHELEFGEPVTLSIPVDHRQFVIVDAGSEVDVDAYTTEASAEGLALWAGGVAVFCDSHWTDGTTVVVTRTEGDPNVDPAAFDHVVLGGLECPSGHLEVFAPEEAGHIERLLSLPAGRYSLLVCGDRFGTGNEYGDDGDDRYAVWLWPIGRLPDRQVLKAGRPGA